MEGKRVLTVGQKGVVHRHSLRQGHVLGKFREIWGYVW